MYYPKSQIQTNLYSNGDLMVLSTKEAYTGYYWTTSGGRSYSGRTPSSKGGGLELGRTVNEGLFAPLNEPGAQSSTSYIAASTDTLKYTCLLYTSPSPRDRQKSRMPSSA